jgi:hypothetical protein
VRAALILIKVKASLEISSAVVKVSNEAGSPTISWMAASSSSILTPIESIAAIGHQKHLYISLIYNS